MAKKRKMTPSKRLDISLGVREGKESTKKQSYASRRKESEGMERHEGKRPFSKVDKSKRKKTRRRK